MYKFLLILVSAALFVTNPAKAQFSISTSNNELQESLNTEQIVNASSIDNKYISAAKLRAEKLQLRRERNTLEFEATLQATQTGFENWESGGTNTFTGRGTLSFDHVYKKDKMTMTSGVSARYGVNVIDNESFKNEDEFKISWQMAWDMSDKWAYGGTFTFRSQFDKGYKSITDNTLVSSFLSPAYTDVALGFTYSTSESPFNITLSPLTGSVVIVMDDSLSMAETAGVEAGKHTKGKIGPSVRIKFDKKFGKNESIRYKSDLYSFTNIVTAPTMRWENTVSISVTKYISSTLYLLAYYDKEATTTKPQAMQYKYSVSLGLSYKLTNK